MQNAPKHIIKRNYGRVPRMLKLSILKNHLSPITADAHFSFYT